MLLDRCSPNHTGMAWTVVILCFCVLMQMLGSTMTLWNFELQLDPVNAPLLEGLSLPTELANAASSIVIAILAISSERLQYLLPSHGLLRPPNSVA